MRDWLSRSNHQLALFIWGGAIVALTTIARGPHGLMGMTRSSQGLVLLVFIALAGPIGWGFIQRMRAAQVTLWLILLAQAAVCIRALVISPSTKSSLMVLAIFWMIFEAFRWDITGHLEEQRRIFQSMQYIKHRRQPRSLWSTMRSLLGLNGFRLLQDTKKVSGDSPTSKAELVMDRFCGREIYPIQLAEWHLYDSQCGTPTMFHVRVETGPGTTLHEDTQYLNQKPFWTVKVVDPTLNISSIVPGTCFTVPKGYDERLQDYMTNFYYGTHEVSDQNSIEILQAENDRLLIRMEGQIADVNYGNSKPASRISLEAWFTEGDWAHANEDRIHCELREGRPTGVGRKKGGGADPLIEPG